MDIHMFYRRQLLLRTNNDQRHSVSMRALDEPANQLSFYVVRAIKRPTFLPAYLFLKHTRHSRKLAQTL